MLIDDHQAPPESRDVAAELQHRTREFTRLYERHAYLVYNLALRTTCEAPRARDAARQAFLERALSEDSEGALVAATVTAALREAQPTAAPSGAGSAESEAMLSATATLQPTERVALALAGLWEADAAGIGAQLGIGTEHAGKLLDASWEALARGLGDEVDAARTAYADWLWASPPDELWEETYRGFARVLERLVKQRATAPRAATDGDATKVLAPGRAKRRGRPRRLLVVAAAGVIAIAGTAAALTQLGGGGPSREPTTVTPVSPSDPGYGSLVQEGDGAAAPSTDGAEGGADGRGLKPLTPAEIDKLRMKELTQLKLYEKRERDKRLSEAQRDYARKRVNALRDLAQRRLAAERRERELDRRERELARREARSSRSPRPRPTRAPREDRRERPPKKRDPEKNDDGSRTRAEADKECLYDSETGTYICPK